ncbi:hypothetical protein KC19_VG263200 [Ceratodon purpureus]|uniref:Uncharacterized protein n=1 Tax=Ceratodon purpureus TaxID=3225 RepID=A0A8T0HU15_CERPU|nr:hypothetical protein KC19_VG263200 [Ceratodon purpureus]
MLILHEHYFPMNQKYLLVNNPSFDMLNCFKLSVIGVSTLVCNFPCCSERCRSVLVSRLYDVCRYLRDSRQILFLSIVVPSPSLSFRNFVSRPPIISKSSTYRRSMVVLPLSFLKYIFGSAWLLVIP